jgi:hypothetical protein
MKGSNMEKFIFNFVPKNVEELKSLPESSLNSPYKTAALSLLVLCNYGNNVEETYKMLDFLRGPDPMTPFGKQFLRDRLSGKNYKPFSFFEGASNTNGYKPSVPLTITISETPYSFNDENWATMYVQSFGADSLRSIKLRKKPSTGQWFLNDVQCLSDIRVPAEEDPWA